MTNNNPKLRFPEFRDEWQIVSLGELCDGGQYGLNAAAKDYDGVNKYLRITDIDEQSRDFQVDRLTSPSGVLPDNYLLEPNDIAFTRTGASTGKTYLYKEKDGRVYFAGFLIRFHIKKANPYFVYTQTLRREYDKWITATSSRSGQPGVNANEFEGYQFPVPVLQEQDKIAEFLTAVDEKIAAGQEKINLLKKYKKGVMQAIFSQKLRFKDENGKAFPDWEEKRLGELGKTYNGLTGKAAEDFGEGFPFVTYKQIFDNPVIDTTKFALVKIRANEKQNNAAKDDVFFTTSSETPLEVGFASVLLNDIANLYLNSFCFGYRINSQQIFSTKFAQFLFRSASFRRLVVKLAQGSTRFNMSKNELMKITIKLPVIEEQKKIADLLTVLDNKINLEERKLEQAKRFKKALLQQMFV